MSRRDLARGAIATSALAFMSACSWFDFLAPKAKVTKTSGTVGPSGGWVVGERTSLIFPPNALEDEITVQLREEGDRFTISPAGTFRAPVMVLVRTDGGGALRRFNGPSRPASIPTSRAGDYLVATLTGASEWGVASMPSACGGIPDCFKQELTLPDHAECLDVAGMIFAEWLRENRVGTAVDNGTVPLGRAVPICIYPAELHASIGISAGPTPTSRVVTVPAHHPRVQTFLYLPTRASLRRLSYCSDSDADYVYERLLEHERRHAMIFEAAGRELTLGAMQIEVRNVPVDATDEMIKVDGYMQGCRRNFLESTEVVNRHAVYHATAPSTTSGIDPACDACQESCCSVTCNGVTLFDVPFTTETHLRVATASECVTTLQQAVDEAVATTENYSCGPVMTSSCASGRACLERDEDCSLLENWFACEWTDSAPGPFGIDHTACF